jgi:surfeit locus 1 family protein
MIRFRPLLVPTLWLAPGLALLVGLGVWQIERLHEKEALIARVQAGLTAPPVDLTQIMKAGPPQSEYRHVRVSGHFLHDREQYLFAQGPGGAPGVHVITPLVGEHGETVLVDRGFVPDVLRDPLRRKAGQIKGEITMTGVLRLPQQAGLFTPAPNPQTHLWFVKDVGGMAKAAGVTALPILVEADATPNPGGWPTGGQTRIDFPNDHLQYAITWFGLALALLGVYLVYHHSRGRLTFGTPWRRESLENGIRQHQGR